MTIHVRKAGLLTTIQSAPRAGLRHLGIPASGAADPLSLALANRLVGNDLLAPALEASLVGPTLEFDKDSAFALTGAQAKAELNGESIPFHETIHAKRGDRLEVGSVEKGARVYVAIAGGLMADETLGSMSTYLPAALGGYQGRALADGDVLQSRKGTAESLSTPDNFRPPITSRWMLRLCRSAETHRLVEGQRSVIFQSHWVVGRRADRMGLELEGATLEVDSSGRLPSAPVFPGTIQCPEDGKPFLLGVDAQTIGGYPRIGQVARADRHLIGQMRPGDHIQFLPRQPQDAVNELRLKHDYWGQWLPGIEIII